MTTPAPQSSSSTSRTLALILLPVLGIALVAAAIWSTRSKEKAIVTVVVGEGQSGAPAINTGDVVDATVPGAVVVPQLGYRYKVFVDDESDDRSSGIAKIGGLVTFIPGARPGQTAIVDVTRVRERVADAVIVKVLSQIEMAPRTPRGPFVPPAGDSAAHVVVGAEMDVVIAEESSKNPGIEGIAKIGGLVVAVKGATTVGERVNVRIVERMERIAFAEPTGNPAGTDPLPVYAPPSRPPRAPRAAFVPGPGDSAAHVVPGAEMDVVIAEESAKNPGIEGIAKIGGLVVAVKGATTVGERVNVRIVERMERIAFAEPTGNPAGTDPLPVYAPPSRPPRAPRPGFVPGPGDSDAHVVPGAVIAATITEASEKNPGTEGVARVNGLVVFVKGATTIGQAVNVRILERRERVAIGEVTVDAPAALPTPPPAAPAPEPAPAPAVAPAAAPASAPAPAPSAAP